MTKTAYSLGTGWGPIDFYQPDLQLLIHHEVKAKELEALVVKMLCADCRLYTHKAASVNGKKPRNPRLKALWIYLLHCGHICCTAASEGMCIVQLSGGVSCCPGTATNYKPYPIHIMVTKSLQMRLCSHQNTRGDTPELTPKELESSIHPPYWIRQVEKHDVRLEPRADDRATKGCSMSPRNGH